MRRLILTAAIPWLIHTAVVAQQDPQYTMFMFNRMAINPAYAGALEATNITVLGRAQWVGIDGAPNTSVASINGYIPKLHGGIGGYIIGDKIGPLSTMGAKFAYAFHLNMGRAKLQIGAGVGIYNKKLDGLNWKYDKSVVDPILLNAVSTKLIAPDVDAGIYFHVPLASMGGSSAYPQDKFFIGASATHILEPSIEGLTEPNATESVLSRDIFAMAGYTFTLDEHRGVYLQPSAQFRMAGPNMQYDINANLFISPMVFGISHRWKDSFSGIVGFNASTSLFMAYSYDYTFSALSPHTTGSHEVIVSYTFPSKTKTLPPLQDVRGTTGRGID